jgi:hypothetical protein
LNFRFRQDEFAVSATFYPVFVPLHWILATSHTNRVLVNIYLFTLKEHTPAILKSQLYARQKNSGIPVSADQGNTASGPVIGRYHCRGVMREPGQCLPQDPGRDPVGTGRSQDLMPAVQYFA